MDDNRDHIAVIGAGIVGICCASVLQDRGFRITLIDRDPPCTGTSSGNAGAIATAEVLPLASPGILAKAPKWLLDPVGPLSVRPTYLPKLVPWLYKFWRASTMERVRESTRAIASDMNLAMPAAERLFERSGLSSHLKPVGALHLYESEAERNRAQWGWDLRREVGVKFEHIDRNTLIEMEPEIGPDFVCATWLPDWVLVSDPAVVGQALADHTVNTGTVFIQDTVRHIADAPSGIRIDLQSGGQVEADQVVLAAGAWSHRLAAHWRERIPLETERGYNTTIPKPGISVTRELIFGEHGFVASPLTSGFRIGGAVELGGLEAPPDYRRSEAMLNKAKRFLPGLKTEGGKQWMGYRPTLPDSKPVIGRSKVRSRIIHAFGHGHVGLAQAPATAELVADVAAGRTPAIDLDPFRPDRF